jgi:RNA polymerase sigma-70 factor, ECF subfamily
MNQDEKKLVKGVLGGKKKWIDKFDKEFRHSVRGFVRKRVESEEDVEEIVQDTMWAVLNSLAGFEYRSSLFSWICAIARRKVVDFYRKKKIKTVLFSQAPWMEEIADKALGPEGESIKKELKEEIRMVMKRLSEGYERMLRLKYVEGRSVKEIGKMTEKSEKAVESKLSRAKESFKKIWKESKK